MRIVEARAAALRRVAEGLSGVAGWLDKAVAVEEIALRVLAEFKPDYPIKTNVEYYAAAVLQGVGLAPGSLVAARIGGTRRRRCRSRHPLPPPPPAPTKSQYQLLQSAGFSRRSSFSRVMSGRMLPGRSQSHALISYFSESRYSSLPGLTGVPSHSS